MNEFDQFVKHALKVKHYARYTDDFIIVSNDREYLSALLPPIEAFLRVRLALVLHPQKVEIRKYSQGIDFLGYVVLPHHIRLRTKTKRRIFRKLRERVAEYRSGFISEESLNGSLKSYLGVVSHATANRLREEVLNAFWLWLHA